MSNEQAFLKTFIFLKLSPRNASIFSNPGRGVMDLR